MQLALMVTAAVIFGGGAVLGAAIGWTLGRRHK